MPQVVRSSSLRQTSWLGLTLIFVMPLGVGCNDPMKRAAKSVQTYDDAAGNLESITYMGHEVRDSDLKRLASDAALKELLIQECDRVTDKGFSAVAGAKQLTKLQVQHVPITDKALESLAGFTSLSDVQLVNTNITGSGLQYLADSPVTELRLQGDTLTADGLAGLSALSRLQRLTLLSTSAHIGDVPAFGSLSSLTEFDGNRAEVGEKGLEVLRGLPNLRILKLSSTDITDKDVDVLNTLVNLEELHILQNSISDMGFARLQLPKLKILMMAGCQSMTDEGLRGLTGLPLLETLNIQYAQGVEGKSLTDLAALKNLKSFEMTESYFKGQPESIAELKELLPDVRVALVAD